MHIGHLDLIKTSEEYLTKLGYTHIKGILIPCHPNYLYRKLKKDALPYRTRDNLLKLCLECLDNWEIYEREP